MLNKKFKKVISSVTMFATVVCLSGVSMLAPLSANAATALIDGDLVKSNATNSDGTPAISSLDIYIVKIVGTKTFKRLVLNPQIFASYGHLKWENIKTVSQAEIDALKTSSLVRVDGTEKVYALTPVTGGDTGAKSWVNVTADQFINGAGSDSDSVYTINNTDFAAYGAKGDITTVTALKAFYKDGTLPASVSDGALKVTLSADTAESANVPLGVGVEFAKFNLTASSEGSVNVDSITFTAGGLDDSKYIDSVAVYDEDGNRLNSTLKDVSSDEANVNIDDFIIKAGETETITVKAKITNDSDGNSTVDAGAEGVYSLGIDSAEDINSDAKSVTGSFPVEGNEMNGVLASGLATLTFDEDGTSLSSVDLGDDAATLAKFKVTGDVADATINKISLKKDTLFTASNDAAENFVLYADGKKVAEADEMVNKYITFNIADGVLVEDGDTVKFVVKGDVVGGAGKSFAVALDSAIDAEAMGKKYPAMITDSYGAVAVAIEGGAVTLEKVDATASKVKIDTDNVVLGTIKVTGNSGEAITLESIAFDIIASGDTAAAGAAYADIENVEIYDATDKSTYDLTYNAADAQDTAALKSYRNVDANIEMESGETHELIVRADTKTTADANSYIVKLTASDMVVTEVEDDTTITDITPSVVTLKKVTVEASAIDLSVDALSATKTVVAGTEGVEAIKFSAEASASDITISELQFKNDEDNSTMDNTLVSGFALYNADGTLIKEVGTSDLSGEEVTFDDLSIAIPANTTKTFYVTVDIVSGNTSKTIQLQLSGYSAEDEDGDVYDDVDDGAVNDGDIAVDVLLSARTISVVGTGSLAVSVDNTNSKTDADIYAVAGTSTPELAALKLKADNEDVLVTAITVTSNNANIASLFNKLSLVKADGTVIISKISGIGQSTVFDLTGLTDGGYIVGQSEQTVFLTGTLSLIGKDQVGVDDQTSITFHFGAIEAEGNDSGDSLTADIVIGVIAGEIAYDHNGNGTFGEVADTATTVESKALGVLASRISSVELVSSYSGTSVASQIAGTGEYNVAIIKVTTDASSNTLTTGNSVKTILDQVKLEVNKNATTMALSGMTIQKIGGNGVAIAGTEAGNAFDAATPLGYVTFNTVGDATFGTDEELAPSSTTYYVVKATVSALEALTGNDWIRIDLDLLNGADGDADATGANFEWLDSSDASNKFPLRLEGTSSIDGTKINEQS